jgi:hypothetical protein
MKAIPSQFLFFFKEKRFGPQLSRPGSYGQSGGPAADYPQIKIIVAHTLLLGSCSGRFPDLFYILKKFTIFSQNEQIFLNERIENH